MLTEKIVNPGAFCTEVSVERTLSQVKNPAWVNIHVSYCCGCPPVFVWSTLQNGRPWAGMLVVETEVEESAEWSSVGLVCVLFARLYVGCLALSTGPLRHFRSG